jgi:TRAP-type C4-dicarboxylate transport system permease small subunit
MTLMSTAGIVAPLQRVEGLILRATEKVTAPLIGVIFLMVFLQVLARYVFYIAMPWVYEFVLFLIAFVAFIGSATAIHEDAHPRIQLLLIKFPPKVRLIVYLMTNLLIIWFTGIFAFEGYKTAVFSIPQRTSGLGISLFWPYLSMLIGGCLMCAVTVIDTIVMFVTGNIPENDSMSGGN